MSRPNPDTNHAHESAAARDALEHRAADAWVAATALFLDVPLNTNNESHFSSIPGLTVISETKP